MLYPHVHMHVDGANWPAHELHAAVLRLVHPIARQGMRSSAMNRKLELLPRPL